MRRRLIALAPLALLACGGARPAPARRPPEPATVAQDLHLRINELAAIAKRRRGDCPRMAVELRELFTRMRVTVDDAQRMANDPALAKQLTTELRRYDDVDRGVADAVSADLLACKDHRGVQEAMASMPVMPADR